MSEDASKVSISVCPDEGVAPVLQSESQEKDVELVDFALPPKTADNAMSVGDGRSTTEPEKISFFKWHLSTPAKVSISTILSSSIFERYFYYSFTTILVLYLSDELDYSEDKATTFYHNFITLCCTFSVIGAGLADSLWDKLRVLVRFHFVYILGAILLIVASIPDTIPQKVWSQLAIFVIAIGSGGIRPCVPAFGGDQFIRPRQDNALERFFSVLHYGGTVSALIATIFTPLLRTTRCFDEESCFPLAFGIQGILLVLSFLTFFVGIRFYHVTPTLGKYTGKKAVKCILHAIRRKISNKGEKKEHWLDYSEDKYERSFIDDIKQYLRILIVLLPAPMFWALFEQQGSRWIFQATRMNGILGSITIQPDQMLILSPLIVLIMAPILDFIVFPIFGEALTPLKKMGIGGFLAGTAFVIAGVVELQVEPTYAIIPHEGLTTFHFINSLPCPIRINYTDYNSMKSKDFTMKNASYLFERDLTDSPIQIMASINGSGCGNIITKTSWTGKVQGASTKEFSIVITERNGSLELKRMEIEDPIAKLRSGDPRLGFIFSSDVTNITDGRIVIQSPKGLVYHFLFLNDSLQTLDVVTQTEEAAVHHGQYDVFLSLPSKGKELIGRITVEQGGSYTPFFQRRFSKDIFFPMEVTHPSTVHMLWLVPQYFVLNCAEIFFSISGMHFTFIESPGRLRTVLQAAWLFSGAIGNILVIAISEGHVMGRQAIEFFFYAGLMGLDLILFVFLAYRYTYAKVSPRERLRPISSMRR